jgi:hypothetical protein
MYYVYTFFGTPCIHSENILQRKKSATMAQVIMSLNEQLHKHFIQE